MVKITKRVVEAADAREKDYLIWDDELPGFGLRVFSSGKRSYVIQYRTGGRSRRLHHWASRSLGTRDCTPRGKGATRSGRWG
jgi:Arm DNA-binding domain